MSAHFLRLLTVSVDDKRQHLLEQVQALNAGEVFPDVFTVEPLDFCLIPESPFAYWLGHGTRQKLHEPSPLEPKAADVRQGIATGDDPRFVRAIWEVGPEDLYFFYYPPDGANVCLFSDPIVRAFFDRRKVGRQKWAFHVKGGSSQPWYSPLTVVVEWENDGWALKNFRDDEGQLRSRPQNLEYLFRPGFSWTRRAVRLLPYVVPSNQIATVSRYMAYPNGGFEYTSVAFTASNLASAFARMFGEKFEFPNFLVETLGALPWSEELNILKDELSQLVEQEVARRREIYAHIEPYQEFCYPALVVGRILSEDDLAYDPRSLLGEELERKIARAYSLNDQQLTELERDMLEAIEFQARKKKPIDTLPKGHELEESMADDTLADESDALDDDPEESEEGDRQKKVLDFSPATEWARVVQYAVGVVFGRWDVRLALDPALRSTPQGPFDPLPVCPPGMLIGLDGLPARPGGIVSAEWLAARPNAITLPPAGAVGRPTIPDSEYPVRIAWHGIAPEDETHSDDLVRRVEQVLELIFVERYPDVKRDMCAALRVESLRAYFRDTRTGLFAFHVNAHSIKQGRRKAPLYWPLQSTSKKQPYTLWVYAHRYDRQTLLRVAQYVKVKRDLEEAELERLRTEIVPVPGRPSTKQREAERKITYQAGRVGDLQWFREKLIEIDNWGLVPTLDDGVVLNVAPLFEILRWKAAKVHWQAMLNSRFTWSQVSRQLHEKGIVK